MADSAGRSCAFCIDDSRPTSAAAKYTCPRCNAPFCSSACYASPKHVNCSEDFYKEWVQVHLKSNTNSDEAKRKIVGILEKFKREEEETNCDDSDDDEPTSDIGERFAGIDFEDKDLDVDSIWNRLTDEEKSEFNRLVDNGDANKLLPIWKPWWTNKESIKLIQEVGSEDDESSSGSLEFRPELRTAIPSLAILTKTAAAAPSVQLKYNVVNVLYAYAFVTRFYNGEHHEFAFETVEAIMEISESIGKNVTFDDVEQAILSATNRIRQTKEMPKEPSTALGVLQDVKCLVEGPNAQNPSLYVLTALSDLCNLVERTRKSVKKDEQRELRVRLKLLEKKLDYYLSWTKDYHQELVSIIPDLQMTHAMSAADWASFEEDHLRVKRFRSKTTDETKHKIEEIN